MTKKDFQMIARVIANSIISDEERTRLAFDFAVMLKSLNDRFDVDRFIEACVEEAQ